MYEHSDLPPDKQLDQPEAEYVSPLKGPRVTIPLEYLLELFNYDSPPRITGIRFQSKSPYFPHEECRMERWDLGLLIQLMDPDEAYFHIELFPPKADVDVGHPASHAEIWTTKTWQSSQAKRWKAKETVRTTAPAFEFKTEWRYVFFQKMLDVVKRRFRLTKDEADTIARAIAIHHGTTLPNGKLVDYSGIATAYGITDLLGEMMAKIAEEEAATSLAKQPQS